MGVGMHFQQIAVLFCLLLCLLLVDILSGTAFASAGSKGAANNSHAISNPSVV
jgi:hypothetical protein